MQQIKWFERKFDFDFKQNIFPSIIDRLEGTTIRLERKIDHISPNLLEIKPNNSWSIKEHIGHLADLEPLWQDRLGDILNGEEYLREADLENKKTDRANHNDTGIKDLLDQFQTLRTKTLKMLTQLSDEEVFKSALHPRLKTPMRVMDLFLFVAEHDDHHLVSINEIWRSKHQ